MNKIRVNMAVEPNDIQTLHCSQYDTEERKFTVDLHENGVGVSPSAISNQLVYKSFKGGTEQILPTNTSTPSTSPIIADIQYKDGLREDEEFLYRESPATEDGSAKLKSIYGNTLVWNQLIQNGNFADKSVWSEYGSTYTVSNNIASVVQTNPSGFIYQPIECTKDHIFLYSFDVSSSDITSFYAYWDSVNLFPSMPLTSSWTHIERLKKGTGTGVNFSIRNTSGSSGTLLEKNIQIIDLTKMFGSTKADEIYAMEQSVSGSGVAYFRSLFALPYYQYDSGSLLSFNGSGIKTVGFNQWDEEWESGRINLSTGANASGNGIRAKNYIHVVPSTVYHVVAGTYGNANGVVICYYDADKNFVSYEVTRSRNANFTTLEEAHYIRFNIQTSTAITAYNNDVCINISSSENGKYEPYQTSTLGIPTSTYFPTGLKSAGSIYDELDETEYITRVGEVDLGDLNWTYYSSANRFYTTQVPSNMIYNNGTGIVPNIASNRYQATTPTGTFNSSSDKLISILQNYIFLVDKSTTDPNTLKTSLSGVKMQYELATPLENYGVVDLGSLTWERANTQNNKSRWLSAELQSLIKKVSANTEVGHILCSKYVSTSANDVYTENMGVSINLYGDLIIYDPTYKDESSATVFKNAMSGIYLLYELNEPKGITSASIVTNYGEMPLYNDNGELKADCIADVSQNSGFQIAKVKLKDENGEIYSNPFQIHTERSPQ